MAIKPELERAIGLIRSDQQAEAKILLMDVLRADPHDVTAWMWIVEAIDDPVERVRALKTCLRFNPDYAPAQQGLAMFRQEQPRARHPAAGALPPPIPIRREAAPEPQIVQPAVEYPSLPVSASPKERPAKQRVLFVTIFAVVMIAIFGLVVGVYVWFPHQPESVGSGSFLDPSGDPQQWAVWNEPSILIPDNGYTWNIKPRAGYQVTARVLGKRSYLYDLTDMRARLSPYDLALGWGTMSDPAVDEWITWSQRGRWYYYEWLGGTPFSQQEIGYHSANTHIITANSNLTAALDLVQINEVIYLEGYLVDAETTVNDRKWFVGSSLTRTDGGNGGCEQLYVTRIIYNEQEYR